jgi:hypothetical protein
LRNAKDRSAIFWFTERHAFASDASDFGLETPVAYARKQILLFFGIKSRNYGKARSKRLCARGQARGGQWRPDVGLEFIYNGRKMKGLRMSDEL